MKLKDALDIKPGEVVSLVGAGGKTTIMFRLAHELDAEGQTVITTTTTKILQPSTSETDLLILNTDEKLLIEALRSGVKNHRHITVAGEKLSNGKLRGIRPETVLKIASLNLASCIIVEADGAAHRSLKAPNTAEPVIPSDTSLVIAVVGIDAVGVPLTEENVFRSEIASSLTGVALGQTVTPDAVALLLTHPQGIIKGSPPHARIAVFINKVDLPDGMAKGRDLAERILAARHPQVERVVLGQAKCAGPAVEIILRRTDSNDC